MIERQYDLEVNVTIIAVDVDTERPEYRAWSNDRLNVQEKITLPAINFLETAQILGEFHALTEKIRSEKTSKGNPHH